MIKTVITKHLDNPDSRIGYGFLFVTQSLIILSAVLFAVSTLPALDSGVVQAIKIFEWMVICIFTVEYLVRIYVAQHRLKFITSFYGIIDLLSILPFFLTLYTGSESLRLLRLLRILRIMKLFRYNKAVTRLTRAISTVKNELILFGMLSLLMLYISAVGIYLFEHEVQPEVFSSVFHAMWWSVATLTTVGYGDIYPITAAGKIFTFLILIVGLGIIAVPTGLIASALSDDK